MSLKAKQIYTANRRPKHSIVRTLTSPQVHKRNIKILIDMWEITQKDSL